MLGASNLQLWVQAGPVPVMLFSHVCQLISADKRLACAQLDACSLSLVEDVKSTAVSLWSLCVAASKQGHALSWEATCQQSQAQQELALGPRGLLLAGADLFLLCEACLQLKLQAIGCGPTYCRTAQEPDSISCLAGSPEGQPALSVSYTLDAGEAGASQADLLLPLAHPASAVD